MTAMDREAICRRVVEVAEQFGAGNPQELRFLEKQLAKCDPVEVWEGLLLVYTRSKDGESNYEKQELAGRMLESLNPKAPLDLDLEPTLRAILPAYNLSIEQVPEYLARHCGKEDVASILLQIESEEGDTKAREAAKVMRWWLRKV